MRRFKITCTQAGLYPRDYVVSEEALKAVPGCSIKRLIRIGAMVETTEELSTTSLEPGPGFAGTLNAAEDDDDAAETVSEAQAPEGAADGNETEAPAIEASDSEAPVSEASASEEPQPTRAIPTRYPGQHRQILQPARRSGGSVLTRSK